METKIPHYHQHHHLLIPHRMDRRNDDDDDGNELGSAGTPATAAATTATSRNGSIYLQEDDEDEDEDEDAATSFSSGSGGSRLRLRSLPPTPEGNEEDCESELLELNDEDDDDSDDDEEAARQQPKGLKAASNAKALPMLSKKKKKKAKRSVATRRGRSRGYLHLSDDQNRYVEALLAQEETLRHVRIVDTSVVLAGILCLVPVLQAALAQAAVGSTGWHFYQSVGNQLAVAAVTEVSLAMLYDTHSSLLAFVGRLTLSVKLLNWIWILFVVSLPVGSILVSSSPSHFGYIVIIMVARFVTALLLWAVRSNPKTWKHDVAPRFPVMLRSIVDCALLVAALFVSLTTAGYLSALLVVAGPVLTRCLLAAFPGLNFD
jgi:uncharacterized membrane protein